MWPNFDVRCPHPSMNMWPNFDVRCPPLLSTLQEVCAVSPPLGLHFFCALSPPQCSFVPLPHSNLSWILSYVGNLTFWLNYQSSSTCITECGTPILMNILFWCLSVPLMTLSSCPVLFWSSPPHLVFISPSYCHVHFPPKLNHLVKYFTQPFWMIQTSF